MTFEDLLTEVYRLVEDEEQFAFSNKSVARHATDAIRRVNMITGADASRLTAALVSGQSEYTLPAGIRRILSVKILPESGTEPQGWPLVEIEGDQIPVVEQDGDPLWYTSNMTGGTSEDQFVLQFFPTPDRSAADSIIVNVEGDYLIESDNPASTPQKAQLIPFPYMYHTTIVNYTAAAMLNESDNEMDQRKGMNLVGEADSQLRTLSFYRSRTWMIDTNRAFP